MGGELLRDAVRESNRGVFGRPSAERSASGAAAACSGVSMSPGSIERKRMPSCAISQFQMRLMWASAALLAPYAPQRAYGVTAASLDTLTTTLAPWSRADAASAPSNARVRRNGPSTFVASAISNASHSVSASSASGVGPRLDALLISTSRPPSAPLICIAIGWISSLRDTSPTMPIVPRFEPITRSIASRWRATKATFAPRRRH